VENTIQAIILAYYNTLIQQEALKVQRNAHQRSRERYFDAKLQLQYGKSSAYDVFRFENAMLIDSTNSIIMNDQVLDALQSLNLAMGNEKNKDYRLTDIIDHQRKRYDYEMLRRKMLQLNRELQQQYLNLSLRKTNLHLIQADRYPTVSVGSGFTQSFNSTKFPELERLGGSNFNFYLNFSVSYNLFDGGEVRQTIEKGQLQEQISKLQIEDVKQELSNVLKNVITNYQTQANIININDRVIQNLKKSLVLEKDRFHNGFSSLLDYRSLQQEYLQAEQTRLEAIFKLITNEVEILKLTGGIMKYNEKR